MPTTEAQDELDMFFAGGMEPLARRRLAAGSAPLRSDQEARRLAAELLHAKRITPGDYGRFMEGDRAPLEAALAAHCPNSRRGRDP
jgi:hypothetical protein